MRICTFASRSKPVLRHSRHSGQQSEQHLCHSKYWPHCEGRYLTQGTQAAVGISMTGRTTEEELKRHKGQEECSKVWYLNPSSMGSTAPAT